MRRNEGYACAIYYSGIACEKIDIIEYSDDAVQFAMHALSPAKISRVTVLDALEKHMEVIVDDSQLSLAIGKKGQNVRLAAKLIGWKVDIKSEEEKRQEVESQMEALVTQESPLSMLLQYGLDPSVEQTLTAAGVTTVEKLGEMTPEQLVEIPGIDPSFVERIQMAVISFYGQFDEGEPQLGDPVAETAVDDISDSGDGAEAADPSVIPVEVDETVVPADVESAGAAKESGSIEAPESEVSLAEHEPHKSNAGPDA